VKIVCNQCGSSNVQLMAWIDPNSNEIIDDVGPWQSKDNNYCNDCDEHVALTRATDGGAK